MSHLIESYARTVRMTLIRWKGETVVLGRNQVMRMLLGVE
jgi:hypothetical protein